MSPESQPPTIPTAAVATTFHCVGHRTVPAVFSCDRCGAYLCPTCVFEIAGQKHLCPACATSAVTGVSPRRRKAMIWGLVMGAFASVMFAVLMTAASMQTDQSEASVHAIGIAMMIFIMVPAIIGLAFSWGAIGKRMNNPLGLWIAVVWNALLVAAFVLLSIIGTFSG